MTYHYIIEDRMYKVYYWDAGFIHYVNGYDSYQAMIAAYPNIGK